MAFPKYSKLFVALAAGIFVLTASAKMFSIATGTAGMELPDTLIGFKTRTVLLLASFLECCMVVLLVSNVRLAIKLAGICWLSLTFSVYRLCKWLIGATQSCSCMGNMHEFLPFSPRSIESFMVGLLVLLLVGSAWFLCQVFPPKGGLTILLRPIKMRTSV